MEQKEKRGQRVGSDRKLSLLSKEREIVEMQKDGEGELSDNYVKIIVLLPSRALVRLT